MVVLNKRPLTLVNFNCHCLLLVMAGSKYLLLKERNLSILFYKRCHFTISDLHSNCEGKDVIYRQPYRHLIGLSQRSGINCGSISNCFIRIDIFAQWFTSKVITKHLLHLRYSARSSAKDYIVNLFSSHSCLFQSILNMFNTFQE